MYNQNTYISRWLMFAWSVIVVQREYDGKVGVDGMQHISNNIFINCTTE